MNHPEPTASTHLIICDQTDSLKLSSNFFQKAGIWLITLLFLTACSAELATRPPPTPLPTRENPAPPTAMIQTGIATGIAEYNDVIHLEDNVAIDILQRTPLELYTGQHISSSGSYLEKEDEAVGPMPCQIQRNSCAFGRLVIYHHPDILYSEAEAPPYGSEDATMHPDMVMPLATLADLVQREWGGQVQIMVTEAYDSQMEHDIAQSNAAYKYSQHFEGRSIDLIPWPPNLDQMPRLCALAHHAGFDWVHNEQDHCHASIEAVSLCYSCSWRANN